MNIQLRFCGKTVKSVSFQSMLTGKANAAEKWDVFFS